MVSRLLARLRVPALLVLALPTLARADDVDAASRARAEVLFQEGSELLDSGNLAAACPRLEAAVELTRGEALGGKLVLARCYERAGKKASAWGLYHDVAIRAGRLNQRERQEEAKSKSEALASELHLLELALSAELQTTPGLGISIATKPLPRGAWGSRIPVDPGEVEVVLSAPGRIPQSQKVVIPVGTGSSRISFEQPLQPIPVAPLAPTTPPPPPREGSFWSPVRIASLPVGIVGLGAMATGAALGGVAKKQHEQALFEGNCSGSPLLCDDSSGVTTARDLGDAGTVVFFTGVAATIAGVVMFAVAPREPVKASVISLSVGPTGAALRGSF
jgi:hypothetical protein